MQRISNINFTFVSSDSFVAECSVRELGINAYDIYEFIKQPWNSIYEEHILHGKFNLGITNGNWCNIQFCKRKIFSYK